jgi:hypothetical protein
MDFFASIGLTLTHIRASRVHAYWLYWPLDTYICLQQKRTTPRCPVARGLGVAAGVGMGRGDMRAVAAVVSCELWVSLAYWLLALLAARGDTSCTPAAALCGPGRDRAED